MRYWREHTPLRTVSEYPLIWCSTHGYPIKHQGEGKICELIRLEKVWRHIAGYDPCEPSPAVIQLET
jgi:hypothetical protein